MEDARRFLRYVIPGLVLILEVSLYLLLSSKREFIQFLKNYGQNAGLPISTFIASGGIGFILANIYHYIYWSRLFRWLVPDHRQLIRNAVKRGWLKLEDRRSGEEMAEVAIKRLTQKHAWLISSSLWYAKLGSSERIKGAEPVVDRLVDIMHSLGSLCVGAVIAIGVWLFAHFELSRALPDSWDLLRTAPVIFIIMAAHFHHYKRVAKDFQIISDTIASEELEKEFLSRNMIPTALSISQTDFREVKGKRKKRRL